MDYSSYQQGLRSRAAPCLTWVIGSTQTRAQYQHSDRQHAVGFLCSQDDPDVRQRQACAAQEAGLPLRERFQAWAGQQGLQPDAQERWPQHGLEVQQRWPQHWQQQGGWGRG